MISWDETKRRINLRKHGIDLADCEPIFDEFMDTQEDEREAYGEQRLRSLGLLRGIVVYLTWNERPDEPHIISCRKAGKREEKNYYQRRGY